MLNRLKALVLGMLLVALVACVSATEPTQDRTYCLYAGDTIGLGPLMQAKDSVVVACIWIQETQTRCYRKPVHRLSNAGGLCVEGQKFTAWDLI